MQWWRACPGPHFARKPLGPGKLQSVCVMGRWSGEQSEVSSTLWELGQVVRSPEDQSQGKGHLAEINSISLRESHLDSLGRSGAFSLRVLYHLSFYKSLLHNAGT